MLYELSIINTLVLFFGLDISKITKKYVGLQKFN